MGLCVCAPIRVCAWGGGSFCVFLSVCVLRGSVCVPVYEGVCGLSACMCIPVLYVCGSLCVSVHVCVGGSSVYMCSCPVCVCVEGVCVCLLLCMRVCV